MFWSHSDWGYFEIIHFVASRRNHNGRTTKQRTKRHKEREREQQYQTEHYKAQRAQRSVLKASSAMRVRAQILLKPLHIALIATYPEIRGNSHIVGRHLLDEASYLGHRGQVLAVPVPLPARFQNGVEEAVSPWMSIDLHFLMILFPVIERQKGRENGESKLIDIFVIFLQILHHLFAHLFWIFTVLGREVFISEF